MNIKPAIQYEARAQIAKALAHPMRLMLLDVLSGGERCVCELTEMLEADQSTVSKHLAVLRQAGLVSIRKEGTMSFYRVAAPCLDGFFRCLETVLKQNLEAQRNGLGRR
jgi:DNA-binding transcriptional ArsR family regulator